MASTELVVSPRGRSEVVAADFKPIFSPDAALERKQQMNEFISKVLRKDHDYGIIPGTKKPTLYKPGAEKLCSTFGLIPSYTLESSIEDWTGKDHGGEPMFYYAYKCTLWRGDRSMGEGVASCNSWESKYRWRWVREDQLEGLDKTGLPFRGGKRTVFEPKFAIDKAETTGRFGKPDEYWQKFRDAIATGAESVKRKLGQKGPYEGWEITVDEVQYRIPNPDVAETVNTIQKISQKRALVQAVLVATDASDAFTQDLEDFAPSKRPAPPADEDEDLQDDGGWPFQDAPQAKPQPAPAPAAQSPHEQQQAASQAQFNERQQTVNPADRPVPEELTRMFQAIDKAPAAGFQQAADALEGNFKALNHAGALEELEALKDAFKTKFRGKGKKIYPTDTKAFLLDLWDALQRWTKHLEHVKGGA